VSDRVTVIGLDGGPLREDARAALSRARLVVGARRHLVAVEHLLPPSASRTELTGDLASVVQRLAAEAREAVVLASGDPGFFGIARTLVGAFSDVAVVPAVSSVAAAFARAGLPWDDAVVVSAHGRDPRPAVNTCRRYPKVAVLTQPGFGPAELGAALEGHEKRFVVAEQLGAADERVLELRPQEITRQRFADPNVVVVLDCQAAPAVKGWAFPARQTPSRWALPEHAFEHRVARGPGGSDPRSDRGSGGSDSRADQGSGDGDSRTGQVTKAEVRAVALAWLGPGLGDLVWDVGAGSGSVAIECARFGAAVAAIDADPEQCARVRANARRHDVPVQVVEGRAPEALARLPDPDAVFIGGGGHRLTEIIRAAADRAGRVVVVALATVERVAPAQRALADAGLEVEGTLVQAARLLPLATGHRLAATNPVVLLRGARP
jgi:precorrin-6Y C5,15-methyltransferase (decarboxylating)